MSSIRGVSVGGNLYDVADTTNIAPKEPTGFASREYEVGRSFIMADGLLYKATAHINVGDAIVVNSNAKRTNVDELFEATENVEAIPTMLNVLGAKNVLPNNATTQVINGVTFTVNSDGSITANGTASAEVWCYLYDGNNFFKKSEQYYMSGGYQYSEPEKVQLGVSGYVNGSWEIRTIRTRDGSIIMPQSIIDDATRVQAFINIKSGVTLDNAVFYPMIRPASIADDIYVPHAKTNKELTDSYKQLASSKLDANKIILNNQTPQMRFSSYANAPDDYDIDFRRSDTVIIKFRFHITSATINVFESTDNGVTWTQRR